MSYVKSMTLNTTLRAVNAPFSQCLSSPSASASSMAATPPSSSLTKVGARVRLPRSALKVFEPGDDDSGTGIFVAGITLHNSAVLWNC